MNLVSVQPISRIENPKKFKKDFVLFPWNIYRSTENKESDWAKVWCPPLILDMMSKFHPRQNAKLARIEHQAFVAYRNGIPVGRVVAHVNQGHLAEYQDATGFFGFFECVDDKNVSEALFHSAAAWLKTKGMKRARGPFSFTLYDEWGWKCDGGPGFPAGYETMSLVNIPHNPPYYNDLVVDFGFTKVQDAYNYHLNLRDGLSDKILRVAAFVEAKAQKSIGKISFRRGSFKHWGRDLALVHAIHENAWQGNWGSFSLTSEEVTHDGKDLKLILKEDLVHFAFVNGEVAGMILGLPDVNEILANANGKLFPFTLLKLLWRLHVTGKWKRGRCVILGVKKEFQGKGLEAPLIVKLFKSGQKAGCGDIELGWILESNQKMRQVIEPFTNGVWMTFRAYEKNL
ncbi:MAG: hypothetical protein JNM63_08355 [Spirochaetia bacterium]|nr:hypothetical protein [Spirochaetia bacterium]